MQNCSHCKVSIKGEYPLCPLCGSILEDKGDLKRMYFLIFQQFIRSLICLYGY